MRTAASPTILLFLIAIASSGTAAALPASRTVVVDGPTIIAFYTPATSADRNKANENESLGDFEFYAEKVREPLKQRSVSIEVVNAKTFTLRVGSKSTKFRPKQNDVGYYFVAPGKKPRIEYGVLTDFDLLSVSDEYFGSRRK